MTPKINCLIVDDEPLALDILEDFITKSPSLSLTGRCANALEAREFLKNNKVDLMFLDIQMPEISGIDLLKKTENPPMVVFTTAFQNYAVEGFNLNAVDYLLKPFSYDRFSKAVVKAGNIQKVKDVEGQVPALTAPAAEEDYMFVKADQKLVKVLLHEIFYIEALADYVKIHIPEKRIVTLQTMKSMEERLPKNKFVRVHRSYIVNVEKIQTIKGNTITLNGSEIPIGKNYKEQFLDKIRAMRIIN